MIIRAYRPTTLLTCLSALLGAPGIIAQQNTASAQHKVIEEIFVTAQKREQSIRDVPISLMALDDRFLAEKGVTDFSELSNFVPNVKMQTDVGAGVDLNIRGFSKQSGNTAFDQAVGLLVDGVPYNDNDFFVTGMVDIARIEVLRGPQGTLLGKNTTAGLLNITTKRPSDEFEGYLDVQDGDFEQRRYEAAIGGPLIPGLINFRVAAVSDERDGIMENTTARIEEDRRAFYPGVPSDVLTRDRSTLRLKLEAPSVGDHVIGLQIEYSDVASIGNATEIVKIDPASEDYLRQFDPNLDVTPNNYINSVNDPSFNDRTVEKTVLYSESVIGDWGLDITLGRANVEGIVAAGDPTPAPLFGFQIETEKPQTNLDIVATSPPLFGGDVDLTVGFFYEDRDLETFSRLDLALEPFAGLLAAERSNAPVSAPVIPLPSVLTGPVDELLLESTTIEFFQNTKTAAIYGQTVWRFVDRWALTAGLRVSAEDKEARWQRLFNSTSTVLLTEVLGYEEFSRQLDREESAVQPKLAINYKPTDDISLFLSWARGYRSGGYNQAAARNAGLEYDREVVDEYAFNAKMRLFDGRMDMNFGAFLMKLQDFQLLTTGPNDLAAVATNAGRAEAKGVELDFRWLATDWLTLATAVGYNDATFTEFPFGPCPADRPNFDGDEDERCDLTGAALPNSPLWSSSFNASLRLPLSQLFSLQSGALGSLELLASVGVEYQTQATTGLPGDDRFTQPEYTRWDASVGIGGETWSFRVTGKNITDEAVNRGVAYIPTTDERVQSLEAPRTVYAQLRWEYY